MKSGQTAEGDWKFMIVRRLLYVYFDVGRFVSIFLKGTHIESCGKCINKVSFVKEKFWLENVFFFVKGIIHFVNKV